MGRKITARIVRSWESNADAWTHAVRAGRIESRRLATDAAILDAVLGRAPERVLDVGCGEGWLCRALAAYGVEAVGVDASPALIEAARARGGGRFAVVTYSEITADPKRLVKEDFDVIVFNFALFEQEIHPLD